MLQCATCIGGKFIVELRRLFTPIFLHGSVLHLGSNLSVQVSLGPRMLATYGVEMYSGLFLASGFCGNLLSESFWTGGVGASTSCMGLAGALLAQVWLVWESLDPLWREWVRNIILLAGVAWLVVEFVILYRTVNHYAHLGGFLGGFALAVMFTREPPLPLVPASAPALPANLGKRRQICGSFFAAFVIACLCKVFVWDPAPTVTMFSNGTLVEVNGTDVFCDQKWAVYR